MTRLPGTTLLVRCLAVGACLLPAGLFLNLIASEARADVPTLTWSGGTGGGNANMVTAGNWVENSSPADLPIANLTIANRNGATGSIPMLFVGGDYAVRSLSFDNTAGRYNPAGGLQITPTTLTTSTITRTLSFTAPLGGPILNAGNSAQVEIHRFATGASMLLNLDFDGRADVFTDGTSQIALTTAVFTGGGGIRKTGGGTLRLESTNTHTGGLTVAGGLVAVNSPAALGANPAIPVADSVVLNGGTLRFENSSTGPSSNRRFQVGASKGTIDISGTSVTLFGTVADVPGESGILSKKGGFILRLATANTYSGGTELLEGRIRYSSATSFGSGPLSLAAGTGILAANANLTVPNDLLLTGGTSRFGGDGNAHIHQGNIDLTGGTRRIRLSDPVTLHGIISNGALEIEADSPSLVLTLTGANTHSGGTTVASGILDVAGGSIGSINVASGASLVIGAAATVLGDIECAGSLSFGSTLEANRQIILNNGILTNSGTPLVLATGSSITGTGLIVSDLQLSAGSSVTGTPGGVLLVLGEITGSGQTSNITRVISPSTIVNGEETSPFGVAVFTTSLNFPNGFPVTGSPLFRFDLGSPAESDRVEFNNASFGFGTGGLDLSKMEFVIHSGFNDGVYQLITSTETITGTLGLQTRGTLGGSPVRLRVGNDGKSIELRVGAAANDFPFTSGQTYFGRNNYIEYRAGDVPVLLVSGHDGDIEPSEIPLRTYGSTARDISVNPLTLAMAAEFTARTGKRPHVILSHLRRNRLDPNREIVEAAQGNPQAEQAWHEYHNSFIRTARDAMERQHGFALTFDMHGHGHDIARLELGYLLGATELNVSDTTFNQPGYAWQSSLRSMILNNPSLPFPALVRGPRSLGERFVEIGVPAWPSATFPTIGSAPFFNGGYTTSEHSCLNCNSNLDAIQIETHFGVRSSVSNRATFANKFSDVLQAYLVDYHRYSAGTGPYFKLSADRTETARGGPTVTLTIQREGYLVGAQTMALAFSGSAIKGTDYTVPAESVSFSSGQNTRTLILTPAAAGPIQGDRVIQVALAPQFRQSTDGKALAITLGDGVSQIIRIQAAQPVVQKNEGSAVFQVHRTQAGASLAVPLQWSGTAVAGGHFDPVASAVFPAAALSTTVTVKLRDDGYIEDDLTLFASLASGAGYTLGMPAQAVVRLVDNDRPAGLTAWMTDELTGNVWQDRSGFARHATTLPGGQGPVANAGAITFDGLSATAALPSLPVAVDGPFSIAFFFRADTGSLTQERNLVSYGNRTQQGGFGVYFATPTQLRTALGNASPITVTGNYNDGNWRHYALTVTAGGTAQIYINGQPAPASSWTGPLLSNRLFWVGWNPGEATTGSFYKGALRDFRIYQKALSPQVVTSLASGFTNFDAWLANFGLLNSPDPQSFFSHYAFGLKPWEASPGAPLFDLTANGFEVAFTRQLAASDIRFEIQRSADLSPGQWQNVATLAPGQANWVTLQSGVTLEDTHGKIRMNDNAGSPLANPRLFYRIHAKRE